MLLCAWYVLSFRMLDKVPTMSLNMLLSSLGSCRNVGEAPTRSRFSCSAAYREILLRLKHTHGCAEGWVHHCLTPLCAIHTAFCTRSSQVRLSHQGLTPYELSAALRHVMESYKSQRHHHHKQPALSAGAAKNARRVTSVAATKRNSNGTGSPGEAKADAIPPTPLPPGETEGSAQGPAEGPGVRLATDRDKSQGRTVAFADDEGGPEHGVVSGAATSAAEAEEESAQTNDGVRGGGSAVSASAASSAEKGEKATTEGGAGVGARHDQASRSAFGEQDWRALEPDLKQFCHKVPYEQAAHPFYTSPCEVFDAGLCCHASKTWAVLGHRRDSKPFSSKNETNLGTFSNEMLHGPA